MGINLSKSDVGKSINLSKTGNVENKLSQIVVGLGWDIARGNDYDLDACALLLIDDKLQSSSDIVSYQNKKHSSGQIWSTGDNLTGAGDGDDEQIIVKLDSIPEKYNRIVFYATIFNGSSRGQNFSKVKNAFIRAVDATGYEMLKLDISGDSSMSDKRSLVFAEVVRTESGWNFVPVVAGHSTDNLSRVADMYKLGVNHVNSTNSNTIVVEPRKKFLGLF